MNRSVPALAAALALLASCATYRPEPMSAASSAQAFEARRLDDPRLARFIAAAQTLDGGRPGTRSWDLARLTLAAVYFHPQLDIARARLAAARAGVVTANEIPNPSFDFGLTYNTTTTTPSPWIVGPLVNFILETFGKRGIRTAQARELADAARDDLASATWQVRGGVRRALLGLWATRRGVTLERRQLALQEELLELLEQRFAAGEASSLDLTREQIRRNRIQLALRELEQRNAEARAQLAAAIGVPTQALDGIELSFGALEQAPGLGPDITAGELRRRALLRRSDVQSLLARYAAAQAALQLALANQYPNLALGAGYTYDQGDHKYTLSPGAELPVFHQNQGPIAQAEARRAEAAARFTALQGEILGEVDAAAAGYRGAERSLTTARALAAQQKRRAEQVLGLFRAGAADRLALLGAQLQLAAARLALFDAGVAQRRALGRLEDASHTALFERQAPLPVLERSPRAASELPDG